MTLRDNLLPGTGEMIAPKLACGLRERIFRHRTLIISGAVIAAIMFIALLAPLFAPHDPYKQKLSEQFEKPIWHDEGSWEHPLGTDHLGRDYLSRLIHGSRISLLVGFASALIAGVIGTALGVTAGYFGGRVDMFIVFLTTVRLSMPVVLVALAVVALLSGSIGIVILILGLLLWDRYAVVIRSATKQIRDQDYVTAAAVVGCSTPRIIFSEIMVNLVSPLMVVTTLEMSNAILLEAALSFLGMGVQPPLPSWGLMVSEAKDYVFFDLWLITIPGFAIFVLVLAINLFGDSIRDIAVAERHS